jgi:IS5 family transposase
VTPPATKPKVGQFVLHAKALHGNAYDGHTLGPVVADMEKQTGVEARRIHVDKGYRGHSHPHKFRIWISGQARRVTKAIRREMRRRATVGPVTGHLKAYAAHHLEKAIGARRNAMDRAMENLEQESGGAGPVERPDPEGAIPDRDDLRDLETLLRPAIGPLSGPRQGDLPSPADGNRLQSEAGKSSIGDRSRMNPLGVRLDLLIQHKMNCRTGPQTEEARHHRQQGPENSNKTTTQTQFS